MIVTAADTWGISGPTFLVLYLGLCGVWAAGLWIVRNRLLGPAPSASVGQSLSAPELALLNGGAQLAVTATAARLRSAGVLEPGEGRRTLRVIGQLEPTADPLEREVVDMVSGHPEIAIGDLRRQVVAGPAVTALTTRMIDAGLLLRPGTRKLVRSSWLAVLPLLALGIVRLLVGLSNHKSVGDLTVILCLVVLAMARVAFKRPQATRAGQAALQRARERVGKNWRRTPTRVASPLAVALFGGGALWVLDPAFAAASAVPREHAGVMGGFTGTSGCGGGGGSGGGGGGCGGGGGGCGGGGGFGG